MAAGIAGLARTPMRIAVITETYPPEVNGVANTLWRMVQGLRERDHAIQLVRLRQHADDLPAASARYDEVLLRGWPIPRYPHLRMGLPCTPTLIELWTQRRPQIVHIATEGPLGWSALRAARHLGLPVVSDFRTNFHAYSRHYGLTWLRRPIAGYLRSFHNRTHATMVPTTALRQELQAMGFQDLHVVSRGVDTARFHPARRSEALRRVWGAEPGTLVVQCVSRLAAEKNLELVGRAFTSICEAGIDARLVFVGDGPLRAELERQLPHAHFAGLRKGDDLAAHYASADLFLFPSRTETFGNVVPEAMASGLPVVAFDLAAAAQLIRSGENGLLALDGAPRHFIELATGIASRPAALRAMAAHARVDALALDWRHVIDELESVMVRAAAHHAVVDDPLPLQPAINV